MQIHTHTCSTFIHTHTHTYTNRARRFCYDVQAWSQKHIVQTSLFDGLCPPDHLPLHVAFLPDVSLEFTWKSGHSMPHARCLILAYSGSKAESQAINATWEGRQLEQFHTWVSRGVWKVSQQMLKHDLFLALGSREDVVSSCAIRTCILCLVCFSEHSVWQWRQFVPCQVKSISKMWTNCALSSDVPKRDQWT